MNPFHLVVLAAGKGTRMKSALPKVLHAAAGLPLIEHVLRTADTAAPSSVVIVVLWFGIPISRRARRKPPAAR